ncbi:MAG: hypothetical protein K6A38_06050 [Lachnospiraceae bacterium]|nr:hypothetical protein [Lachnospiraceae bacterium]
MKAEKNLKKKIIQHISFGILLVFLVLSYCFFNRLLSIKSEHGIRQAREMYAQPINTIDVVFLGSSHIHCDVNTALLWEKYGIASYDYSAAEQPLWITYHYLREICKYQDPKVVVVDLYSPARYKYDYQYPYLSENLYGFRFSINKLEMIYASCEPERYFDYFPSIALYNSRYTSLGESDFEDIKLSRSEREAFKGYSPYYVVEPQEEPLLEQPQSGGITLKSEIYLYKIIDFCKENEIEIFLMVSPYITTDEDELVYNRVHEIADMEGINFNSTNYFYNKMELNFEEDFNDESHLNYRGSCKFSDYLGEELKSLYEIPDRRGNRRWESWDRHVEEVKKDAGKAGYNE